ncbi:MAG: hypothetical protein COB85_07720 [Bacteroidetes bacterium]|nr:MAG: hypothetical protein COB85_07720 [Bacteroidota bacterium]
MADSTFRGLKLYRHYDYLNNGDFTHVGYYFAPREFKHIKTYPRYEYIYKEDFYTGELYVSAKSLYDSTYVGPNLGEINPNELYRLLSSDKILIDTDSEKELSKNFSVTISTDSAYLDFKGNWSTFKDELKYEFNLLESGNIVIIDNLKIVDSDKYEDQIYSAYWIIKK